VDNRELLRTLSGCKFYRDYLQSQQPEESSAPRPIIARLAPPRSKRRLARRVYRKYCLLIVILLAAAVLLIISPLWLVHPPYGKAFLLSLPPMLLCALSWMSGAWWAWDKDRFVLLAVTVGAMPARLLLGLAWAWLVLSIPGTPCFAFVLGLMWHWMIFTIPELGMVHELSRGKPVQRAPVNGRPVCGGAQRSEGPK
jgi:O-antigen/teichoic acid export membrane protein